MQDEYIGFHEAYEIKGVVIRIEGPEFGDFTLLIQERHGRVHKVRVPTNRDDCISRIKISFSQQSCHEFLIVKKAGPFDGELLIVS